MFAQTVLLYPALLALLALGAGLLVERASAVVLPPALLPMLGAAALVALSQLCTYVSAVAPTTQQKRSPGATARLSWVTDAISVRGSPRSSSTSTGSRSSWSSTVGYVALSA